MLDYFAKSKLKVLKKRSWKIQFMLSDCRSGAILMLFHPQDRRLNVVWRSVQRIRGGEG